MLHLMAYSANFAATQTLANLPAVNDTIISSRNNDFLVTDDFNLVMAYGLSSTVTELRFNWPTYNAYGFHEIFAVDQQGTTASVPPDRPMLVDYWSQPMRVPKDEPLDVQVSNAPGTTEQDTLLLWLATPGHSLQLPSGIQRITVKATYSFTPGTAYAWTGAQALTFQSSFRGGWYWVVGMDVFDTAAVAARLIFPKGQAYNGRVLRPGVIPRASRANRPADRFMGRMGPLGFFNSFELPAIEILSTNTSAHAGDCRFDLVYVGDGAPPAGA